MHILLNGGLLDLDDLTGDDINPVQIAKALSRINRFMGNFQSINVAQHAVIVSNVVERLGGTLAEQMAALHHDDAEAIIGDIPSMVKEQCESFQLIENDILDVIDSKYRCETRCSVVVKADMIVGNTELAWHIETDGTLPRMMAGLAHTDAGNGLSIAGKTLIPWGADASMAAYLDTHDELMVKMVKELKSSTKEDKPVKSLGTGVN